MEIEYKFDINDWMEFQKNYMKNSKQFKRSKLFITLSVPFTFGILTLLDLLKGKFNLVLFVLLALISFFWILLYPKRVDKNTFNKAKKVIEDGDNSGIIGQHKLIINDEGILQIKPDSEQKIKWRGIKKVEDLENYYFLYTSSISAIIIPKNKISNSIEELDKLIKKNII